MSPNLIEGPSLLPRHGWQQDAECQTADPAWFEARTMPKDDDPNAAAEWAQRLAVARRYCNACPVLFECRYTADSYTDYPMDGFIAGEYRSWDRAYEIYKAARERVGKQGRQGSPAGKHGPTLPKSQREVRNRNLVAAIDKGEPVANVALMFGVEPRRVYDIYRRATGGGRVSNRKSSPRSAA